VIQPFFFSKTKNLIWHYSEAVEGFITDIQSQENVDTAWGWQ
jgi:hypothetical protein